MEFVFVELNVIQEFGMGISARKIYMSFGWEILEDKIMLLHDCGLHKYFFTLSHMARFKPQSSSNVLFYTPNTL